MPVPRSSVPPSPVNSFCEYRRGRRSRNQKQIAGVRFKDWQLLTTELRRLVVWLLV